MSKRIKHATFEQALKKSLGKRIWKNLSKNERGIVHDFAKLEKIGGPVGSSVSDETLRPARQA